MRFRAQYQYRPKSDEWPLDYGQSFDIVGGPSDFMLLPNIGDHVEMDGDEKLDGIVETDYSTT